jgi:hypothetical protein
MIAVEEIKAKPQNSGQFPVGMRDSPERFVRKILRHMGNGGTNNNQALS